MISFLNLIRWKNLLIMAFAQYLIKYALLVPFVESYGVKITLNDYGFLLLVLSTLCIAAAGYVINDIYDVEADKINKPDAVIIGKSISEKNALTLFITLNILGVGLGFYLSQVVDRSGFFVIFFVSSALLYIYATYLKQLLLIGNLVISIIVALSIIIVGVFELLPVINTENSAVQIVFFKIITDYAIFAFCLTLLREIVKDIQDINGDYKVGINSLPIAIGRERATKLVFVLTLLFTISVIYYLITYLYKQSWVVVYFLGLIIAPLIYICIKLFYAETNSHYKHLSLLYKLVMLTGIFSLLLYKLILA